MENSNGYNPPWKRLALDNKRKNREKREAEAKKQKEELAKQDRLRESKGMKSDYDSVTSELIFEPAHIQNDIKTYHDSRTSISLSEQANIDKVDVLLAEKERIDQIYGTVIPHTALTSYQDYLRSESISDQACIHKEYESSEEASSPALNKISEQMESSFDKTFESLAVPARPNKEYESAEEAGFPALNKIAKQYESSEEAGSPALNKIAEQYESSEGAGSPALNKISKRIGSYFDKTSESLSVPARLHKGRVRPSDLPNMSETTGKDNIGLLKHHQSLYISKKKGSKLPNMNKMEFSSKGPVLTFGCDLLSQMVYENALREGKETDKTIRLMVLGCHGQGKTSLTKNLLGESTDAVKSTNGIDIVKCTCTAEGASWKRQLSENAENESLQRIANVVKSTVPETISFVSGAKGDDVLDKLSKQLEKKGNSNEQIESITIWDFGGQFVYYATHQLFLSRKAVYLLVFDLSIDLSAKIEDEDDTLTTELGGKTMKDYIEFWMNSIHSYVGNEDSTEPAVILVGTHADKLKNRIDAEKYIESVRDMFSERKLSHHIQREHFAISNINPSITEIENIQKTVISIGRKQNQEETIPAQWIPLERALKDCRDENIITMDRLIDIDNSNEYPIRKQEELKSFLEFHHTSGTFFYFDEGEMSQHVVVNPQILVHAFRCIITSKTFCARSPKLQPMWKALTERAILFPELLHSVWKNEPEDFTMFQDILTAYLKKHRIIGEAQQTEMKDGALNSKPLGYFIVPSLLKTTDDGSVKDFIDRKSCTPVSLVYEFQNEAIVPTIFQRITAAAVGSWPILYFKGKPLLFEDVSVYKINLSHAAWVLHANRKIEILIISLCTEADVSEETADYFRRFTDLLIDAEFQKLRHLELEGTRNLPFKQAFRCFHKEHSCKGSVATYQLELVQDTKNQFLCCPDHVSHDSLIPTKILKLWFGNQVAAKDIPKRKLTDKEYSYISTHGVGYGWEHLGLALGVPAKRIEQIDMECKDVSMKMFKVFKEWDKIKSEEATLDVLVALVSEQPRKYFNPDTLKNLIDKLF
ncbi:uncharacterized protein LOC123554019 isoform X2 [Mercenaria mercenaria]|uniref:uncharacterized protein LOC123554019 isoform X2 n=1 Tax=Mercenaria mercenaria TaxID=6596 RepID=UPI00234EDAF2|nr:uncharacterized protein LOC123554019 isoform X2 [Mercenaria mercenaria]